MPYSWEFIRPEWRQYQHPCVLAEDGYKYSGNLRTGPVPGDDAYRWLEEQGLGGWSTIWEGCYFDQFTPLKAWIVCQIGEPIRSFEEAVERSERRRVLELAVERARIRAADAAKDAL